MQYRFTLALCTVLVARALADDGQVSNDVNCPDLPVKCEAKDGLVDDFRY